MRRLIAIDNHHVVITQPARTAAGTISNLAHYAFAAHLEPDPLGRFDQFIEDPFGARIRLLTHLTNPYLLPLPS